MLQYLSGIEDEPLFDFEAPYIVIRGVAYDEER
jgi:hypothetical protein